MNMPRLHTEHRSTWSNIFFILASRSRGNACVNVFVKPARRENCHSKVRTLGIAFPLLMVFQANQDCCKRSAISALDNWGIGAPSRLCRRLACDKYIDAKALNVALVTPKLSDNYSKTSTSTHHDILFPGTSRQSCLCLLMLQVETCPSGMRPFGRFSF